MKSFFKKLAFVMALAMVVSLAAPAAAQADELEPLYLALQGTEDEVKEVTIALDKTDLDFCFKGAKAGWLALLKESEGWKSSNTAVATVDGEGKVTPVAAGTTEITYQLKGYEVAKATVKVEAPKAEEPETPVETEEFFLGGAQESHITYKVAIDGEAKGYNKENVTLYRVFETLEGPVYTFWPLASVTPKDNTITVAPFVAFGDGDNYRLVVGEEYHDFTTMRPKLEDINYVVTTFGQDGVANKAEVSDEDEDIENIIDLGFELWYVNGATRMNLTELFKEDVKVKFELLSPTGDDVDEVIDFDDEGEISFTEIVTATVKAVVTYEGKDNKDVTVEDVEVAEITPSALPVWGYGSVTNWTLYKSGTFKWGVKEIPAGEKGYKLVLEITDTLGNKYVTLADDAAGYEAAKKVNKDYLLIDDAQTNKFIENEYWLQYYSTNTDDFLINESYNDDDPTYEAATLTTYKETTGVVYVALHQTPDSEGDSEETFVDNIFAVQFKVTAPRKYNGFDIGNTTTFEVMADAEDTAYINNFTQKTITIKSLDQYGEEWVYNPAEGGVNPTYKLVHNYKYVTNEHIDIVGNKIVIDGAKLYKATEDTKLEFAIQETETKITKNFTVKINLPDLRNAKGEKDEPYYVVGKLQDKTKVWYEGAHPLGWDKDGDGEVDQVKYYDGEILLDLKNGYPEIKFVPLPVGFALTSAGNQNNYQVYATVQLQTLSNDFAVGYHDVSKYTIITNDKWKENTTGVEVGDQYLAVYYPDGKLVPADKIDITSEKASGTIKIKVADNADKKMTYDQTGDYKVVVYTVDKIKDKELVPVSVYTTVKVSDNRKHVKFADRIGIYTDVEASEIATLFNDDGTLKEDAIYSDYLKAVVLDAFSFTLNGAWKINENVDGDSVIESVTFKTQGDYIIIRDVTFKVPVKDSLTALGECCYYVEKVEGINMSVKLGGVPEEEE